MAMLVDFFSDVSIKEAPLARVLNGATVRGVLWQATSTRLLLDVPDVARYLVEEGSSISIHPATDVAAEKVDYFLGMLPLAALVFQRGLLALHAAAATNGDAVVLLAGNSGCGKSTLLTGLLQRGWRMLADDLTIVGLDAAGQPMVYPTHPRIMLWQDSLTKLGIASEDLCRYDANRQAHPEHNYFDNTPRPLRGIYCLNVHGKPGIEWEKLAGSSRFQATARILYNSQVADALCDRRDYMRCVAALAASAQYEDLRRPRGTWCLETLIDHINARWC